MAAPLSSDVSMIRARLLGCCLAIGAVLITGSVRAQQVRSEPDIHLLLLRDGYRSIVKGGDLSTLLDTKQHQLAESVGMRLNQPNNPILNVRFSKGRIYYAFYKTLDNAFADRPYVIQRIRKTERTWAKKGSTPTERVTYQVEVFKLLGGAIKRPDQHHGRYSLKDNYRRQILKDYEIGFGELAGKCEGTGWPFDPGRLFVYLQQYDESDVLYKQAKLVKPVSWSLDVDLTADGKWRVASPELGFDAPKKMPQLADCDSKPIAGSRNVVLVAGKGPKGFKTLAKSGGKELSRTKFANGKSAVATDRGLRFSLDAGDELYRVGTVPGFLGATDKGIRHGDTRARVAELMGLPKDQSFYGWHWRYRGMHVRFDGLDRVERIWVDVK